MAVPGALHVIPIYDEIVRDGILPCRDAEQDLRLDRRVHVGPAECHGHETRQAPQLEGQ